MKKLEESKNLKSKRKKISKKDIKINKNSLKN